MKLTIVIPALNEELAIASIIERCRAARAEITSRSPVSDVEIIVVSDGSTDRTAEIARSFVDRFADVRLKVFERNRGYGAAIKAGFEAGSGELVGFLDADGTCDPVFFGELCRALVETGSSVAIGSRVHSQSRMPRLRRFGNRMYALMLSTLSNRVVTDTASGMRVIRRDALPQLYPLPDGLHFTPAMSARVLMDDELTIVERPMPYDERIGESKLHVLRDGVRFLRTILDMTLVWRPQRLFFIVGVLAAVIVAVLAAYPVEMWLREGRIREDMIYRLLFCSLGAMLGAAAVSGAVISEHVQRLLGRRRRQPTFVGAILDAAYSRMGVVVSSALALPVLLWLVGPGVWTWLTLGRVEQHWSRAVVAGMVVFGVAQQAITSLLLGVLRFHTRRESEHTAHTVMQVEQPAARTRQELGLDTSREPVRATQPIGVASVQPA